MAFTFPSNPSYFWDVTFYLPEDGEQKEYEIRLKFARLPWKELEKLTNQTIGKYYNTKDTPTNTEYKKLSNDFLKKVVVGWEDVVDDNGNEITFTTKKFEEFLDLMPGIAEYVFDAYNNSQKVMSEKN